jgi:hypothetical protein
VANLGNSFTAHPESRLPAPLAGNFCPVTFSSRRPRSRCRSLFQKNERSRRGSRAEEPSPRPPGQLGRAREGFVKLCTRNRPTAARSDRTSSNGILDNPTGPDTADVTSSGSGPRYRGSNPCLPAISPYRTNTYAWRVSIQNPCLSSVIPFFDFDFRSRRQSSPVFLHILDSTGDANDVQRSPEPLPMCARSTLGNRFRTRLATHIKT